MNGANTQRMGSLLALLVGFLVLGGPLVLLIWHEVSELLMGRIHPGHLAVAMLLLGVLWLASGRAGNCCGSTADSESVLPAHSGAGSPRTS
jgi:hypothetical protein